MRDLEKKWKMDEIQTSTPYRKGTEVETTGERTKKHSDNYSGPEASKIWLSRLLQLFEYCYKLNVIMRLTLINSGWPLGSRTIGLPHLFYL